jgi:hypothetical protein
VLLAIALLSLPLSIAGGWGEPPTSGYALAAGLFASRSGYRSSFSRQSAATGWPYAPAIPAASIPFLCLLEYRQFPGAVVYPVLLEPMFTLRTQNLI